MNVDMGRKCILAVDSDISYWPAYLKAGPLVPDHFECIYNQAFARSLLPEQGWNLGLCDHVNTPPVEAGHVSTPLVVSDHVSTPSVVSGHKCSFTY